MSGCWLHPWRWSWQAGLTGLDWSFHKFPMSTFTALPMMLWWNTLLVPQARSLLALCEKEKADQILQSRRACSSLVETWWVSGHDSKMIWWARSPRKNSKWIWTICGSQCGLRIQILCRCFYGWHGGFVIEDGRAVVVEAAEQDYSLQPTAAVKELTVFGRPDDGIVHAPLASLSSSIHRRVMVEDKTVDRALVCCFPLDYKSLLGPMFSHQPHGVRCGLQTTQAVYEIIGTSTTNLQDYVLDAPKTGEKKLSALGDEVVMSVRRGCGNVVMVDQVRQVGASDVLQV